MRDGFDGAHIFDAAEEIGLLDDDGGGGRAHGRVQVFYRGDAVARWHLDDAEAARVGIGMQDGAVLRINRLRNDDLAATARSHRQQHRLDQRGRAIVERGIGDIQSCYLADHGLKLVDGLQHTLAHFWLVGRVRGDKLGTTLQVRHDAGYGMIVATRAQEGKRGVEVPVLRRHTGQKPFEVWLGQRQAADASGRRRRTCSGTGASRPSSEESPSVASIACWSSRVLGM